MFILNFFLKVIAWILVLGPFLGLFVLFYEVCKPKKWPSIYD